MTNLKFSNVFMIAGVNINDHRWKVRSTMRETYGISMQSSNTWSKNLDLDAVGSTYTETLCTGTDYD